MNQIKNWRQRCAVLVLLVPSFCAIAAGIDPALTTPAEQSRQQQLESQEQLRQQQILKSLRQQQEIKPDARNAGEQLKGTAPIATDVIPDTEAPCFSISKIELIGDAANQFQFALNEVLNNTPDGNPLLGRCLGVVGINAVMARVQNAIIAKGYVTTRVLAAPQNLQPATLQLTVMPGRVNPLNFLLT